MEDRIGNLEPSKTSAPSGGRSVSSILCIIWLIAVVLLGVVAMGLWSLNIAFMPMLIWENLAFEPPHPMERYAQVGPWQKDAATGLETRHCTMNAYFRTIEFIENRNGEVDHESIKFSLCTGWLLAAIVTWIVGIVLTAWGGCHLIRFLGRKLAKNRASGKTLPGSA